jgi:transcriptional regulator with XRE-family HTH domain
MSKIKMMVDAGIAFPDAVKAALGMSIREFAEKHGLVDTQVSGTINGSSPWPNERVRNALAEELGVEREWIDDRRPLPSQRISA